MRFGVCCSLEQAPAVLAAGFDYVELPAKAVLSDDFPPQAEATNLFVFTDLKLVGPERGDVSSYGEDLFSRAAAKGLTLMVIGSGGARRCPEGYDLAQAHEEFYRAAETLSQIAKTHGITLAPESLRREETNVGNDLGPFAQALAARGVAYTCDTYHVLAEPTARPLEIEFWREAVPFKPAHVHLGTTPRDWRVAEEAGLEPFAARLKELGYDGRVSFEVGWGDFEAELPLALEQGRQLFR